MTKVQAASVISRLPIVPFLGKKEKVKADTKAEMDTTEPTTMAPPKLENPEVPPVTEMPRVPEMPQVSEQEREITRTVEPQVTPSTSGRTDVGEVNLEKDAETSGKTPEPVEEPIPEMEKTNSYQHYIMTGKGDTPEQKVNEAVKDLNYHNMLVVIAVRDKTINKIGSICAVAEKWGLSYSIVQSHIRHEGTSTRGSTI